MGVTREQVAKSLEAHDGEEFATLTSLANSNLDGEQVRK